MAQQKQVPQEGIRFPWAGQMTPETMPISYQQVMVQVKRDKGRARAAKAAFLVL